MAGIEWTSFSRGLGAGASAVAILAAAWAVMRSLRSGWRRTVGRRRGQTALLDQLVCGASINFVESVFGPALFSVKNRETQRRIYRLEGAWVAVDLTDDAVRAFTITVTDEQMYYRTQASTFGQIDLRLGRDTVAEGPMPIGEHGWVGARRAGYNAYFYFGNPGAYQHYWLSYSDAGVGEMHLESGEFRTGCYSPAAQGAPEKRTFTSNSLTVLAASADPTPLMSLETLGADLDTVRLRRA